MTTPVSQRLERTRMLLDDLIQHVENDRHIRELRSRRDFDSPPVFKSPPTLYPILPVEIIDNVCQKLSSRDLASATLANTIINPIASRRLYHTITAELSPLSLLKCMRTLDDSNNDLALLVRTFEINFINQKPTKNYYDLLERILKKMVNLTTLVLELPKRHSPTWVLPMPSSTTTATTDNQQQQQQQQRFKLRSFTTSMHCKRPLASFLDSQPEITELTLRGINQDSNNPLFPFISALFNSIGNSPTTSLTPSLNDDSEPESESESESKSNHSKTTPPPLSKFKLQRTSLPKLTHFNAIHAGPKIIRNIITSRPVTHISIPLFPPSTMSTLLALTLTSKPLNRLSVMSFDPTAPYFLFQELADRFKDLEALHVVVLMAEVNASLLMEWGPTLVGFKKLKYITFMAALSGQGGDDVGDQNVDGDGDGDGDEQALQQQQQQAREEIDERKIARVWHASCPTLKTIILPQGKVWFEGTEDSSASGDWKCLNWDE